MQQKKGAALAGGPQAMMAAFDACLRNGLWLA